MRFPKPILLAFVFLSGCLLTEQSILDETNAVPASQSIEFKDYTRRELTRTGQGVFNETRFNRKYEDLYAVSVGGLTVISEIAANDAFTYFAVGTLSDGTPLKCTPNTRNEMRMNNAIRRFNISFTEIDGNGPIPFFTIGGQQEDIANYILDEFRNGNLLCEISGRPEPGG